MLPRPVKIRTSNFSVKLGLFSVTPCQTAFSDKNTFPVRYPFLVRKKGRGKDEGLFGVQPGQFRGIRDHINISYSKRRLAETVTINKHLAF